MSFSRKKAFLLIFTFFITVVSAQEDVANKCQNGCKHKVEYCEPYESKCLPCEPICIPPANQKFADCVEKCAPFLQDLLIQHYNEPNDVHMSTIEGLLIVVTGVTSVTLVILLTLVILKIVNKGSLRSKTDILPMYQLNGAGSETIRTLSTSVPDTGLTTRTNGSRIPSEDRVPSNRSSYDNPAMIPSPSHARSRM